MHERFIKRKAFNEETEYTQYAIEVERTLTKLEAHDHSSEHLEMRRVIQYNPIDKSEYNISLTADEHYLLVCEYGENGSDAEIVAYKKWR